MSTDSASTRPSVGRPSGATPSAPCHEFLVVAGWAPDPTDRQLDDPRHLALRVVAAISDCVDRSDSSSEGPFPVGHHLVGATCRSQAVGERLSLDCLAALAAMHELRGGRGVVWAEGLPLPSERNARASFLDEIGVLSRNGALLVLFPVLPIDNQFRW